jgi:hypothetical protein
LSEDSAKIEMEICGFNKNLPDLWETTEQTQIKR